MCGCDLGTWLGVTKVLFTVGLGDPEIMIIGKDL